MDTAARQVARVLLADLTIPQKRAVCSRKRRSLVVAGAGSGKTEVIARRVAWWVGVEGVPKERIVAFTFTEKAAEEMKFRIRQHMQRIATDPQNATLGDMYVGTIHGFCLRTLRQLWPDLYHNFDIADDPARYALVHRGYHGVLGLAALQQALGQSQNGTIQVFLRGYDLLHEYDEFRASLADESPPLDFSGEGDWCREADLLVGVGIGSVPEAFAVSAARYYAYLISRRFMDFSTSQTELLRRLEEQPDCCASLRAERTHVVVDEVQDLNPVQDRLVRLLTDTEGSLTAVGDHRQAVFAWRGARVEIMGALFEELTNDDPRSVVELPDNFRSTPRIVTLANRWAQRIAPVGRMSSPDMLASRSGRQDVDDTHVGIVSFTTREDEADWIAGSILRLVNADGTGARHDAEDGSRGLCFSDIAVLVRSRAGIATYMDVLQRRGIPAVCRGGAGLFSQPEVLLMLGVLALVAGDDQFIGSSVDGRSLPNRIADVLGCPPETQAVVRSACTALRARGLPLDRGLASRLIEAAGMVRGLIFEGTRPSESARRRLRNPGLAGWLARRGAAPRRVFPQRIFLLLLAEAGLTAWDAAEGLGEPAMYHLGQLSSLIKGIETPGWASPSDFRSQMHGLCIWGPLSFQMEEAPLLVPPNAVTVTTVHSAKGLEFPAVFLADVNAGRFPARRARTKPDLPFDGPILRTIDPSLLADSDNYDHERRLMYVALTRAERFLFVSRSGSNRSRFFRELEAQVPAAGGVAPASADEIPAELEYMPSEARRELKLSTSFSDLRYYLECPHDFYFRKVLGFAPPIDQAFGYGRGVHNLLRAIHTDPRRWAGLADDPEALRAAIEQMTHQGLFYLRYTTGAPLERMRRKAGRIVSEYVARYAPELAAMDFEPEREFETLIDEGEILISGAVDLIRQDDPPRVTLIDFKSGEPDSDSALALDEDEMRLQLSLYGLAARNELEYEPELALVRYLDAGEGETAELRVPLDDTALASARRTILDCARNIRKRAFRLGPQRPARDPRATSRCAECDYSDICGMQPVGASRASDT